MMLIFVQANVIAEDGQGWRSSAQVPNFFLDTDIQGVPEPITEEKLRPIVSRIVNPQDHPHIKEIHLGWAEAEVWKRKD